MELLVVVAILFFLGIPAIAIVALVRTRITARQIEENWHKNQKRLLARRRPNRSLAETLGGLEGQPTRREGCLLCQL